MRRLPPFQVFSPPGPSTDQTSLCPVPAGAERGEHSGDHVRGEPVAGSCPTGPQYRSAVLEELAETKAANLRIYAGPPKQHPNGSGGHQLWLEDDLVGDVQALQGLALHGGEQEWKVVANSGHGGV